MASLHQSSLAVGSREGVASANLENGLVISCGHDATPRLVSFGIHADSLIGFAKYLLKKENEPGYKLISLKEMRDLNGASWHPRFGSVELFGQRHTLHWIELDDETNMLGERHEGIVSPPMLLTRNCSSIVHSAQQKAAGPVHIRSWRSCPPEQRLSFGVK